jgi:predicted metal-binding membrane protein
MKFRKAHQPFPINHNRHGGNDRWIVHVSIAVLTALAWVALLWYVRSMPMAATGMTEFPGVDMRTALVREWSAGEIRFLFPMWAIMMVAMMTPSVTPMILMYAHVARESSEERKPLIATGWFTAGYLLSWTVFSLVAASAQGLLERTAWLDPMMAPASNSIGGAILIVAGLYQFTPLKDNCLRRCQSPTSFLQSCGGFKTGMTSSIWFGIRHGLYCIGCCWALMMLLFAGGVMNIFWIAAISTHLVIEKVLVAGHVIARLTGAVLAIAGLLLIFR